MFLVGSGIGCWASSSIGRVARFGCDGIGLDGFGFEEHFALGRGLVCARVDLRGWAGLIRVCLRLRLLMPTMVCLMSRDLDVMSCARKVLCGVG